MRFLVTGMARGGTTIVAKLFNSLEDGFCLGEPYHYRQHNHKPAWNEYAGSAGKVSHLLVDASDPWEGICSIIGLEGLLLGGIKEALWYGSHWPKQFMKSHIDEADFFIVVFREPLEVYSSMIALGWSPMPISEFTEGYRIMDALSRLPHSIPVSLKHFRKDPLGYLNNLLPFEIQGELDLQPTGHSFGDPYANRCVEIHNYDSPVVVKEVLNKADEFEECIEIWRAWSSD